MQPGSVGHSATNIPSSSCSMTTRYLMSSPKNCDTIIQWPDASTQHIVLVNASETKIDASPPQLFAASKNAFQLGRCRLSFRANDSRYSIPRRNGYAQC